MDKPERVRKYRRMNTPALSEDQMVALGTTDRERIAALEAEAARLREAAMAYLAAVEHYSTETFREASGQKERAYERMELARRALAALIKLTVD